MWRLQREGKLGEGRGLQEAAQGQICRLVQYSPSPLAPHSKPYGRGAFPLCPSSHEAALEQRLGHGPTKSRVRRGSWARGQRREKQRHDGLHHLGQVTAVVARDELEEWDDLQRGRGEGDRSRCSNLN